MKSALVVASLLLLAGCTKEIKQAAAIESQGVGRVVSFDPAFLAIAPRESHIEKVAGGFEFTEGPIWRPDGHLLFSDVVGNVVRSVTPDGVVQELIPDGGGGSKAPPDSFRGPNGMVAEAGGSLLLCQHSNRRIVQIAKDLQISVFLDKFEGKRFNSPNDLGIQAGWIAVLYRPALRSPEAGFRSLKGT